jgi:transposase
MRVVHERCCGLDIHKQTVVACLLVAEADGPPRKEVRTFGTMTEDVVALAAWLRAAGCTQVAMESTGVYWKPIWNLLEEEFVLLLANAQHVKRVPGRKTDVGDAEWLADLLRHGLLQGSRVPDRAQRELQELTRYRTKLIRERAAEVNRLQKTLEGANIKLAGVASNIAGVSARQMLAGLIAGEENPTVLAELAQGRLREKRPLLAQALAGRLGSHQRFLLAQQLAHLDFLDEQIAALSAEIGARLVPFAATLERVQTIPGVGRRTAEVLLAEVGPTVEAFPSAGHLASWAGLCPGNHQSGGKRHGGTTRKGNPWLRTALVEAARAASRSKGTYLAAQYGRLTARRGSQRAAVAVAHSILVSFYHVVQRAQSYQDLGGTYFVDRDRQGAERRFVRGLEHLGYRVTLQPAA